MSQDPIKIIEDSAFFDGGWYRRTYPDVTLYDRSAAHHYAVYGAQIGRDPGPDFSTAAYLARNPEVAEVGHNPLWHYELYGRHEGRETSPSLLFDSAQPDPVMQSLIDRSAAEPLPAAAQETLQKTFAARLDQRPHRLMTEFDHVAARRFVNALSAQHDAELVARNTTVSVIMATYNRGATLTRAVRSVLGQSHHNLELIVVDDGSTDFTADVLRGLSADSRLICCHTEHAGVSAARNAGLGQASGEVIFYLDSDNLWTADFLRLMLAALVTSGARCGYAASLLLNREGAVAGYRGEPFDWAHCIDGNYVDLNVFCHRADMMREFGTFDGQLRRMVDWDLILRYTSGNQPVYCPFIGCLYSDDAQDKTRISTSKPYIFERVVSYKNARGYATIADTLADLRFSIAIKQSGTPAGDTTKALVAELEKRGHRLQVDGPDTWGARHPHQNEVVLILPDASDYVPHPEQFNLALGVVADDRDDVQCAVDALDRDAAEVADDIEARVSAYLEFRRPA
ncbi:hypothetical protein A8B82_21815 [Sulfitobacter sp. EhC04]|uniref:glycosyltransferase family 2 protein n=1 Tax=Sulfitobacter sp. EhC04 TaxID=1849168 RepID=UPI0007F52FFC|nr:glycosyltransferase [Sulfitobacter sp. EhC04]OAN70936.1 hypothetical protein A8B82_21815 [Sulfitobacter sp. EhC04]